MKKYLVLLTALLLLSGCERMYPDEYLSVNEHDAPFAYRETEAPTDSQPEPVETVRLVSRASDIREAIQELVMNGEESGRLLCKDYKGKVFNDMQDMSVTLLRDSPKYNYAMDSFDWSLERTRVGVYVNVRMKLRFTPQELQAIETRLFPEPALSDIQQALRAQVSSFMVQVSGYQQTDFNALLDEYILLHPDQIVEAPGISVAVFPDRGNIRVVDVHFVYRADRDTLRQHREETNTWFNLTANQLTRAEGVQQLLETLYKHLVPGMGYEYDEEATVYSQVIQKVGSSRTMASVVAYLCNRVGTDCEIVLGEREGESWYWNRVLSEGRWYHFDLHAAALSGELPILRPAAEMTGYSWDTDRYPEPEPSSPPTESTEPTETTEA